MLQVAAWQQAMWDAWRALARNAAAQRARGCCCGLERELVGLILLAAVIIGNRHWGDGKVAMAVVVRGGCAAGTTGLLGWRPHGHGRYHLVIRGESDTLAGISGRSVISWCFHLHAVSLC
jgi:hypothetical protein